MSRAYTDSVIGSLICFGLLLRVKLMDVLPILGTCKNNITFSVYSLSIVQTRRFPETLKVSYW